MSTIEGFQNESSPNQEGIKEEIVTLGFTPEAVEEMIKSFDSLQDRDVCFYSLKYKGKIMTFSDRHGDQFKVWGGMPDLTPEKQVAFLAKFLPVAVLIKKYKQNFTEISKTKEEETLDDLLA